MLLAGAVTCALLLGGCSRFDPACSNGVELDRSIAEQGAEDWRAQLDSIVTAAPADSVLDVIVFVLVTERAAFVEWAARREVPITYEFMGFSAFLITPTVADLPSLRELSGVTGIDWGMGPPGEFAC
jgi:hypothetical protein